MFSVVRLVGVFCWTLIIRDVKNMFFRDAPITHWPIISQPIIGAEQIG